MSNSEDKYFVRGFLRFLNRQIEDPTFSADGKESLEVAIQCLENVYEITPEDEEDKNPLNHIDLYEMFRSTFMNVSPERKQEAETLKNEGNRLMKEEKYHEALNTYTRAINIDGSNPVFYCNRAAAYSRLGDYQKASDDCKMSLRYDPNYSKAYGRLGLAYSKMNKHEQALAAYQNALAIEPDNQDYKNNMQVTQQRLEEMQQQGTASTTGLPPGLGSGIQGIDFASALNNPALVGMATRMMNDPSIQNVLSQLSGMNNVDALMETGRQLAQQMSSQNPEVFASIIRQMEHSGMGTAAGNEPEPENPDNSNSEDQNPPTA